MGNWLASAPATTRTGLQVRTLIVAKILGEDEQDDEEGIDVDPRRDLKIAA